MRDEGRNLGVDVYLKNSIFNFWRLVWKELDGFYGMDFNGSAFGGQGGDVNKH